MSVAVTHCRSDTGAAAASRPRGVERERTAVWARSHQKHSSNGSTPTTQLRATPTRTASATPSSPTCTPPPEKHGETAPPSPYSDIATGNNRPTTCSRSAPSKTRGACKRVP